MLSQLPDHADPWRLCDQGKFFEGSIALKDLQRLAPLLASLEASVEFILEFDRDIERRHRVKGHVSAKLEIICQRCMHNMELDVSKNILLSPIKVSQQADTLPDEYDPLIVIDDEEGISLLDLIEDELILAIPPAPMHVKDDCAVDLSDINQPSTAWTEAAEQTEAKENPFAALLAFKKRDDD